MRSMSFGAASIGRHEREERSFSVGLSLSFQRIDAMTRQRVECTNRQYSHGCSSNLTQRVGWLDIIDHNRLC